MTESEREKFEAAVIDRLKESGFSEVEIRVEGLVRCDDGYQDEVINGGWHYWNAAVAGQQLPISLTDIDPALVGIEEEVAESGGHWTYCSGCYDTEDGHPTQKYAYSPTLQTPIGCGCHECGGLGAVWWYMSDQDVADFEKICEEVDTELELTTRISRLEFVLRGLSKAYAACNGEDHPAYEEAQRVLNGSSDPPPPLPIVMGAEPVAWLPKDRWERMTAAEPWLTNVVYSEDQSPSFSCIPLYGAPAIASAGWIKVPADPTLEFLKSINADNQVLAYENGRYYNAWFEFEPSEGGWLWTDEADSEPNPSHYRLLSEVALSSPMGGGE